MSQPDEFLDRLPSEPLWPEPSDRCTDCDGTGMLTDPAEPCLYCDGTGRREGRPVRASDLRRLEAALVGLAGGRP